MVREGVSEELIVAKFCMISRNWPGEGLGKELLSRTASGMALILESYVLIGRHMEESEGLF